MTVLFRVTTYHRRQVAGIDIYALPQCCNGIVCLHSGP